MKMMALTPVLPHAGRYAILDLEAFGILIRQTRGRWKSCTIDKNFSVYEECKRIVLITTGLGDHLRFIARQPNDILHET